MTIFLSYMTCLSMAKHKKSMMKECERYSKSLMEEVQPLTRKSVNNREVTFTGHVISEDGIRSDPEKIESVEDMTTPQNVSDVRRFLRMVNQLGRFIPHLAEKTKPLRDLLSKKNQFHWGQAQQESFKNSRMSLSQHLSLLITILKKPQSYQTMHHHLALALYSYKSKTTKRTSLLPTRQDP